MRKNKIQYSMSREMQQTVSRVCFDNIHWNTNALLNFQIAKTIAAKYAFLGLWPVLTQILAQVCLDSWI